jgi:hypothetical protein
MCGTHAKYKVPKKITTALKLKEKKERKKERG